jgi:hypothetical protein
MRVPQEVWAPLAAFAGVCNLLCALTGSVVQSTMSGWGLAPLAGDDRLIAGFMGVLLGLAGIVGLNGLRQRG